MVEKGTTERSHDVVQQRTTPAEAVRVLIVDDEPRNLSALEAILDGSEYQLVMAASGEEALRQVLRYEFAVILLDVQMPGIDGFETAHLIRQRERSRTTPIIFLTALSKEDRFVYKGYSLGAVDYLFKPLDAHILNAKVDNFVELFRAGREVQRLSGELQVRAWDLELANMELGRSLCELQVSEERYRSLVETASDMIYRADVRGCLTYVNPQMVQCTGYPPDKLTGMRFADMVREDARAEVLAFYEAQRAEGVPTTYREIPITTVDGCEIWIGQNVQLLHEGERIAGSQGVARDITRKRESERSKDEFLSVVSHELRTPLTAICGSLGLLASGKLGTLGERGQRILEIAAQNSNRLVRLINDLLDIAKMESGRVSRSYARRTWRSRYGTRPRRWGR